MYQSERTWIYVPVQKDVDLCTSPTGRGFIDECIVARRIMSGVFAYHIL